MMIDRRILREYQYFQIDSPKGYKVRFVESLFHWEAIMIGPQTSPYAGGVFLLNIHFSDQHPFQAPNITFQTKVILTAFPLLNFDYLLQLSCNLVILFESLNRENLDSNPYSHML